MFSALVKELGAPVLSGGRYDYLADDFGKHIPAVGFAMGLKRILVALERQGGLPEPPPFDAAILCEAGGEAAGYAEYLRLTGEGKRVYLSEGRWVPQAETVIVANKEGILCRRKEEKA